MAIDQQQARHQLFGGLDSKKTVQTPSYSTTVLEGTTEALVKRQPKWENMEQHTVFLAPGQKDWLDTMAKKIMRARKGSGKSDRERITANTLLRCILACAIEDLQDQFPVIQNEEELMAWLYKNI
jgi:hypothetical protein